LLGGLAVERTWSIPVTPKGCARIRLQLENVDEVTADTFHAFGRMMHLNRLAMARMIAQHGAHHGEVVALALLSQQGGLSQRELAETLHLSPPRVSTILRALEKSGAVMRHSDEEDRRRARVFLTEEGRRRELEQRQILGKYVNQTIGTLPENERRELGRLLGKLADRTKEVLQEVADMKEEKEPRASR
jgi:DNA-binding MarR family transcriptional regulator